MNKLSIAWFKVTLAILLTLFISISTHGYYQYSVYSAVGEMINSEVIIEGIGTALALFVGTITGIITSVLISRVKSDENSITNLVGSREIIIACIISPLVVAGFYEKIIAIDSIFVVFILAHQNGYFWENVSSHVRAN